MNIILEDWIDRVIESRWAWAVMAVLVFVVLLFWSAAVRADSSTVRLGQEVEISAALICRDLEAAKLLSDLMSEDEFKMAAMQFSIFRICGIASGSMAIDELMHQGKRYNVFKTSDATDTYFWVTAVKPQFD